MSEDKERGKAERLFGGFKRSSLESPNEPDWPQTLRDLLEWHTQEVMSVSKEAELRLRLASQIVADCVEGRTTLAEAGNRKDQYSDRWGEPLRSVVNGKSEAEILKEIDENIAFKAWTIAGPEDSKWQDYLKERQPAKGKGKEPPRP